MEYRDPFSEDTALEGGAEPPPAFVQFAPRWRRLVAVMLDGLLLGVVGFLLGVFLRDQLVLLGDWGRLVGFVIAVGYYGAANSQDFGGQTVGKALTGIRVVGVDGLPISVPRSVARAAVLWAPFFLNGSAVGGRLTIPLLPSLLSVLVFGGTVSVVYLFLFNGPTRQSVHDLLVGSVVVEGRGEIPALFPPKSVHLVVMGVFVMVSACAPLVLSNVFDTSSVQTVFATADAVASESGARARNVVNGSTRRLKSSGETSTTTFLQLEIRLPSREIDLDDLGNQVVEVVLSSFPEAETKDLIILKFSYGYDIGIWSMWIREQKAFTPANWRERIGEAR